MTLVQLGLSGLEGRPTRVFVVQPREDALHADQFTPRGLRRVVGLFEVVGVDEPRPVVRVAGEDRFEERPLVRVREHGGILPDAERAVR